MEITTRKEKDTVVVSVRGRMDALCAPDFDRALECFLEEGASRFVIDFSALEYISSAGLQCILAAARQLEEGKGEIFLADLKGPVREVFEISGFDTLFPIYDTVEAALNPG
ncbi:MAG: STAS domain-containing protein [Syntrophaceae bacterium]|nr:STAS domain-containing protein [Syntrophaceae bacterium]